MLDEIVCFIFIIILAILLRSIPHIRFYYPGLPDTFYFLNKFKDVSYREEDVKYPPLFYRCARFLIRNKKEFSDRRINQITPAMDIATMFISYLYLRMVFGIPLSLATLLLYSVTPFIVRTGVCLNSRPFGLLLFTCSVLSLTFPWPWNVISIVPISLTLLSHRLSTQALFFVCLASSFIDATIGFIFIGGFILAVLVSKGEYLGILENHLSAIYKYAKGNHYPNKRLMGFILTPSIAGFAVYESIIALQGIITFPLHFGGVVINPILVINSYVQTLFSIWILVCLFLLAFWVAGESYKHMYLASLPSAFFSAYIAVQNPELLWILFLLVIVSLGISLKMMLTFEHLDESSVLLMRKLRIVPNESRFFMVTHYVRASEFFSGRVAVPFNYDSKSKQDIKEVVKSQHITHGIIEKKNLHLIDEIQILDENEQWVLFEIQESTSDP